MLSPPTTPQRPRRKTRLRITATRWQGGAVVTQINGDTANNISDWKLGATYTIDGWVIALSYIATNRDLSGGTAALTRSNISGNTGVLSVAKTF